MSQPELVSMELVLDSVTEGVFTVDRELNILTFNRAAEDIIGVARSQAVGAKCYDVFRANICQDDCLLNQSMRTGGAFLDKTVDILDATGRRKPISVRTSVIRDAKGQVLGGVETFRDLSTEAALRKELEGHYTFGDIVGRSAPMQNLFAILPDVAESEATVLIQGQSGTGKELFARAIHNMSARAQKPFLAVNCAALPDTLLESELFGYVKGAFTDARSDKPGRFEAARGGTLFLDEIGEISQTVQVKLLRVLDEQAFVPLGSNVPRQTDVRLVAATNLDLQEQVHIGKFRADLFYRLNIIRLDLPPLSQRREDIPYLVEALLAKLRAKTGKEITRLTDRALAVLMSNPFPGNVRQLENFLEHGFVLCRGQVLDLEHLPREAASFSREPADEERAGGILEKAEQRLIIDALQRHGGRRKETADELGISTTTLWRRMKTYGLI
ncbi:MAG: sigma 54-interacting transcriptional regulator [Deltaproteobacteria bacterium]|nr:sigma 54-interacting transcriptional regulator [Deltaproteobacteria bacterium]